MEHTKRPAALFAAALALAAKRCAKDRTRNMERVTALRDRLLAWAAARHMVLACSAPWGAHALALPEFTTTAVAQPSSRCSMVV